MTLAAWPDFAIDFYPLNDPFEQDPPDPLLATDFEQGLPRHRRVFRNAPTTFNLQWAMPPADFAIFKGFYGVTLGKQFTVPVFSDTDYVTVTAQWVKGSVKWTRSGGEWIVTAQVQTMDKLSPSEDEYACTLLTYGYGGSLDDFIALFHTTVHVGFYGALV